MAFVHPQSCECAKSELDIFAVPPTQTSIESGMWVEYNPISAITHGLPIEFNVLGTGQDYLDLANTQIQVSAKIVRGNDTDIDGNDAVGPVNLTMHSLFSEVDVKLNDTIVSSTNNTYAYRAYLETLLSFSPAAKESQLTASLYYKDTAGHMEDGDPTIQACSNTGIIKRRAFFANSRTCEMMGKLHVDIFFQDRFLPSDVGLKIRLVRQKDAFCLMSSNPNAAFKLQILDCKLIVRKVKLSPTVFLAHAKALEVGTAKYPIRRVICKTFTVSAGNLNFSQESVFSGQLPTRLVICMTDNDSMNGVYRKNPFNFKNYNLETLKLYLDGMHHHIKPLEMNFPEHKYIEGYMSLFSGTEKLGKDEGIDISRSDYSNGYTIYAFDLSPDLAEGDHFNLAREGNVRLDAKFSAALPNTINVIVYGEFENVIELDRNKNVVFDFNN